MRLYIYAIKFYTNIPLPRRSRTTILRNRRSRRIAVRDRRGTRPRKRTHACRHSGACMPRRSRAPAARDRDVARRARERARQRRFRAAIPRERRCHAAVHHLSPASPLCGRGIFSQFFSMHVYKRKRLKTKVYIQILFPHPLSSFLCILSPSLSLMRSRRGGVGRVAAHEAGGAERASNKPQ